VDTGNTTAALLRLLLTGGMFAAIATIIAALINALPSRTSARTAAGQLELERLKNEQEEAWRQNERLRAERDRAEAKCEKAETENDALKEQKLTLEKQLMQWEARCERHGNLCHLRADTPGPTEGLR
jgi:septal ring factor EnvC (AmiA/AmiB activator)